MPANKKVTEDVKMFCEEEFKFVELQRKNTKCMYMFIYCKINIFPFQMFSYHSVPFWVMGEFSFKVNIRYTFWQLSRTKVYAYIFYSNCTAPPPSPLLRRGYDSPLTLNCRGHYHYFINVKSLPSPSPGLAAVFFPCRLVKFSVFYRSLFVHSLLALVVVIIHILLLYVVFSVGPRLFG